MKRTQVETTLSVFTHHFEIATETLSKTSPCRLQVLTSLQKRNFPMHFLCEIAHHTHNLQSEQSPTTRSIVKLGMFVLFHYHRSGCCNISSLIPKDLIFLQWLLILILVRKCFTVCPSRWSSYRHCLRVVLTGS